MSTQQLTVPNFFVQVLSEAYIRLRVGDWLVLLFITAAFGFYLGDGKLWFIPDPHTYIMYVAPQKSGELRIPLKRTRDIGQRLQEKETDIAIFWASQSGVSEQFAERLSRDWRSRLALKSLTSDLGDYEPEYLATFPRDKLAVFLMSTYGEGDPPDNAISFCSGLEKMHKNGTRLESLRYCAMGMGNKNYKHYNQVIKVLDNTLRNLGAHRIGPVGLADESLGATEDNFMEWKDEILESLGGIFTLHERQVTYEPSISITHTSVDPSLIYLGEPNENELHGIKDKLTYNSQNLYSAPISQSIKLSSVTDRVCVHQEFDLSAVPALRYQTGDHLAVWPINPDREVNRLLRVLDLDDEQQRQQPIMLAVLEGSALKCGLPSPTTREALLKYYLEIGALVSRDFLLILSEYAPTSVAKAALLRLGNSKVAFRREVAAHFLSAGKIMEMVEPNTKWTGVPFSLLVESFNRIQPRKYSISSSPLKQPRRPSITLVINRQHIPTLPSSEDNMFFGLSSNYLLAHHYKCSGAGSLGDSLEGPPYDLQGPRQKLDGGKVYVQVKRSTFKLPPNLATPVIMVAAGTGVAPFRGFMQERSRLAELGKPVGKMILFFGCRNGTTDYLYREEWQDYEARLGDRFRIVPAFSRVQGQRKCYVQDVLFEQKDIILPLILDQSAAFYICGSAVMAKEVRSRLLEIIARANRQSLEEADKIIMGKMKKAGLYHEDVWS
ncbi:hypothetical protein N7510_006684 [Penicillium lagena]|uniref:uncharacterized protein n=1 Tax=Penicillium lagena TaxID=94218 RepID=UPI00253FD9FA|nr:uncharacterized protein N7510_006684 [Penicillium lagena]KAJ5609965.1 hypothetical protein N7510_006684 [Penicillium lagena]